MQNQVFWLHSLHTNWVFFIPHPIPEFGRVWPTFSALHWAALCAELHFPQEPLIQHCSQLEYLPATHAGTPSATSVKGRWGIIARGTIISVFSKPVYLLKSRPNGSDMILLKATVALTFAFVSERTGPIFISQGKHHSRWCRLANWQPWTLGSEGRSLGLKAQSQADITGAMLD